ncbi:MAG: hypothetical protein WCD18_04030 [Thermosynechococcaceae cyanobacterium]
MDDVQDVLSSPTLNRLWLFTYLIPVFGMLPATWTLTRRTSNRHHRSMGRLAFTLGMTWVFGSLILTSALGSAGENGPSAPLSLLFLNSLLTSGYFVVSLWLMLRLSKHQTLDLPGLNRIAKHLP